MFAGNSLILLYVESLPFKKKSEPRYLLNKASATRFSNGIVHLIVYS